MTQGGHTAIRGCSIDSRQLDCDRSAIGSTASIAVDDIRPARGLARTLAPEIRVNAVATGRVGSPGNKDCPADRKQQSVEKTPLKRPCTPQGIADAIFFLCAGTSMVTGRTLIVDGGFTL